MTNAEREKLEKQLKSAGATQSSYDNNKWKLGNNSIRFDSSNGFNQDGDKLRGYGNCSDRIKKS